MSTHSALVLWLSEIDKHDSSVVGEYGVKLGELLQADFPIPEGFVVSSRAYFQFLEQNELPKQITSLLQTISWEHPESLMQISAHIKKLFIQGTLSQEFLREIDTAYRRLGGALEHVPVIIRTAGFHQQAFTDVQGDANLILKIRETWAELFEPNALLSRHKQQHDHFQFAAPVIVQRMINPEKSGVMLTIDPLTNDKNKILIEAVNGHYQQIRDGKVLSDHYEIHKKDLSVITKHFIDAQHPVLSDNQLMNLALLGYKLDRHQFFAQDITWAIQKGQLYLLDTKHIPVTDTHKSHEEPSHQLKLLIKGAPASPGMVSGPIRIITDMKNMHTIHHDEIVVLRHMHIDYTTVFQKARAIITDYGSRTSRASIMARHLGIPTVIGNGSAMERLHNGLIVTVNGTKGEVYEGSPHTPTKDTSHLTPLTSPLHTHIQLYVSLSTTSLAENTARDLVNGVGLIKGEILMREVTITPEKAIEEGKTITYATELATKIAIICKAFHPRPVFYRFSDQGPVLGLRGAYRHIHHRNQLKLEAEAIKMVRDKMLFSNLGIIVPFLRKVRELHDFKQLLSELGLYRSPTFKIWMMVQTPANIFMIDDYAKEGIDGLLIDTDSLSKLVLGIDPTQTDIAHIYDETDPAVLAVVEQAITSAHKHQLPTTLTSTTLSNTLLEKAVHWGVTNLCAPPDRIHETRKLVGMYERKIVEGER